MSDNRFYLYGLFYENDQNESICFYIGKGTGYRIDEHFTSARKGNNTYKDNKIEKLKNKGKTPFGVKLVENLTNKEALQLEQKVLRKDKVFSEVTNLTRGGEGLAGYKHSEETKLQMSKSRSGEDHHFYGKERSADFKEKLSETMKGRRTEENHPLWNEEVSEERRNKISENVSGEQNGNSNLSRIEARQIKNLAKEGKKTQKKIAREFGISPSHVSDIKRGRRWSCLE